jgi:hypothetical protein
MLLCLPLAKSLSIMLRIKFETTGWLLMLDSMAKMQLIIKPRILPENFIAAWN